MILFFSLLPILLLSKEISSNGISSDIWFINDDKKKIVCDISISSVSINSKSIFCNNTDKILENFDGKFGNQYEIKIRGTSISNSIKVNNTIVNIILENVKITTSSSFIIDDSTVYLFIHGDSNMISSTNDAGIQCSDSFIQIMNATSQDRLKNTLTVSSDKYAGIGGGSSNPNCKGIYIYGGRIIANGGEYGAGIGGGEGSDKINSAGVNIIEIKNGDITSTGGSYGAGIGGGSGKSESSSRIDSIKIFGGKVQSFGGEYSSGIGGGYGFSKSSSIVNSIEISGGEISAKGGTYGSGIGNGYSSNREASIVHTIVLDTSVVIANSIEKSLICTTIDATKGKKAKKAIGNGFLDDITSPNIIEKGSTVTCQSDGLICSFSPSSDSKCKKPWKCSFENDENCPKCSLQNCEHSNVYCICDLCIDGFVVKDGLCVVNNETTENTDSSSCNTKIENCIEFLNGNCHICDKCSPGFIPSVDKSICTRCSDDFRCKKFKDQCKCETCDPGFAPDPSNNFKCRECITANCAVCEKELSICEVCSSGYTRTNDNRCEKCSFSEQGSEFSCSKFAPNSCNCEKCQSGYALDNGRCASCSVPHCHECPVSRDRCVSCLAGFEVKMTNFTLGGEKCVACNVKNCVAYSIGCSCSACSSGFQIQNGVCLPSQAAVTPFVPDQAKPKKKIGVAFCTNENEESFCHDFQSNWEQKHKMKFAEFASNKINDQQTRVSEKLGFQAMLECVNSINSMHIVISSGIKNFFSNLNETDESIEISIFQFGSMQQEQLYDFRKLSAGHSRIQIFSVRGYLTNFQSEVPKISIFGGKLKKVDSISVFFGSLEFNFLVELNQLVLIASSINGDMISLHTNVLIIDSHNIGLTSKMNIETKSFGVVIPESEALSPSISVAFADNSFIVKTSTTFENSIAVSSVIGKEQTMIITTIKKMELKIDDSMKSKSISKLLNISFKSNEFQNYNGISVSFDQQSNWNNVNFKKGVVFEIKSTDQISIQNHPRDVKIVVNKRNKDGQLEEDDSNGNNNDNHQNSIKPKAIGLPDSAINAIILSFICASSVLILSIFFFFKKKPKVKKVAKDSTTPLLHQVFIDGF